MVKTLFDAECEMLDLAAARDPHWKTHQLNKDLERVYQGAELARWLLVRCIGWGVNVDRVQVPENCPYCNGEGCGPEGDECQQCQASGIWDGEVVPFDGPESVCEFCGHDMRAGVGCDMNGDVMFDDGETLCAVPYGCELGFDMTIAPEHCRDCRTPLGLMHHPGCVVEQCPRCTGQAVGCGAECDLPIKADPELDRDQLRAEINGKTQ